jgi:hypothetical protein
MIALRPRACAARVFEEPVGRPMSRHDAGLVGDAEPVEGLGGMLHRFPVGLAAHDDADRAGYIGHVAPSVWSRREAGSCRRAG